MTLFQDPIGHCSLREYMVTPDGRDPTRLVLYISTLSRDERKDFIHQLVEAVRETYRKDPHGVTFQVTGCGFSSEEIGILKEHLRATNVIFIDGTDVTILGS